MQIQEKESKKDALRFLMKQKVGVLSTIYQEASHGSFVYYIADEDFNIYIAIMENSRKHEHLYTHPRVSFTVGSIKPPCTVQMNGIAEIVKDEKIIKALIPLYIVIATTNNKYPVPITKLNWEEGVIMYKIVPTWLQWSNFSDSKKASDTVSHILINNHY